MVAALSEHPTDRYGVSLHGARSPEAVRLSGPSSSCASFVFADRGCRSFGIIRWAVIVLRVVHPANSLFVIGGNGRGLLYGACTTWVLADLEQGGTGGAVLLYISLSGFSLRRLLGARSFAKAQRPFAVATGDCRQASKIPAMLFFIFS